MNSVADKVLNVLSIGEELTAKQISSRFSVANPRDVVYNLRQKGHEINLIERTDTKGRVKLKYSMNNV